MMYSRAVYTPEDQITMITLISHDYSDSHSQPTICGVIVNIHLEQIQMTHW